MGLQVDSIRAMLTANTVNAPKGSVIGPKIAATVYANDQLSDAKGWNDLIVGYTRGRADPVSATWARRWPPTRITRAVAWQFPGKGKGDPTAYSGQDVMLAVFKQPGANIIKTVQQVKAVLPQLQANIPPAIKLTVLGGPDPDHQGLGGRTWRSPC